MQNLSLLYKIAIRNAEHLMSLNLNLQKYFKNCNFGESTFVYFHFIDGKPNQRKQGN